MKIALVHGQAHRGSTYHLAHLLLTQLLGEHETTEFFLPRDLPHFCLGCYRCLEGDDNCPYAAEKQKITDALDAADLLIFTTPNYCFNMSAPMKSFFDLTFTRWIPHRPRGCMFHKTAVVLSTTAGVGAGQASKLVAKSLRYWGVPRIYRYGVSLQAMNWNGVSPDNQARCQRDMGKLAAKLSRQRPPRAGLWTRVFFSLMGRTQKAGHGSSPVERQYWQDQGWLDGGWPWKC